MGKKITFRSEARESILRGATQIADAERVTLGPKSKCVLIDKKWGKADCLQRWGHDCQGGIVDPTKVVKIALENAVSIAGVLLLSEATLTELPKKASDELLVHSSADM
jgi:chaperonin GroEL (HSP60 family)